MAIFTTAAPFSRALRPAKKFYPARHKRNAAPALFVQRPGVSHSGSLSRGVAELCCGRARVDTEDMTTDEPRPAIELVVLLASAGGLSALSIVLRDLPTEFPAAVVVQQHLGGLSSVLPTILGRQTPHRVSWAADGQAVAPGEGIACPPGVHLELTAH